MGRQCCSHPHKVICFFQNQPAHGLNLLTWHARSWSWDDCSSSQTKIVLFELISKIQDTGFWTLVKCLVGLSLKFLRGQYSACRSAKCVERPSTVERQNKTFINCTIKYPNLPFKEWHLLSVLLWLQGCGENMDCIERKKTSQKC